MPEEKTSTTSNITMENIRQAYAKFHDFVSQIIGERKANEFAHHSYRMTCQYFSSLESLKFGENNELTSDYQVLKDRDILGFSLWMYNFISELKNFMIGVGNIDPAAILGTLHPPLEQAGFFEYFRQAEELKYFD